jgi:hypothetical protein
MIMTSMGSQFPAEFVLGLCLDCVSASLIDGRGKVESLDPDRFVALEGARNLSQRKQQRLDRHCQTFALG